MAILATFVVVVLCLVVVPEGLARSRAFDRHPRVGLVVWSSVSVVGWSSTVVFFLRVALGDSRQGLVPAVSSFLQHLGDGHPLRGLGLTEVVGLSLAFDVAVLFVGGVGVTAIRAWRTRARQRVVLDLVAEPVDRAHGVSLLAHSLPIAYYLPGDGGRVVLSTGTFQVLSAREVDAVVAHEMGHRRGLHGAVLIPLQVLSSFVAFLPLARRAPTAMRSLLEMSADDFSRARRPVEALRGALEKAPLFQPAPRGALAAFDGAIERRIRRLERAPTPKLDLALIAGSLSAAASVLGIVITAR